MYRAIGSAIYRIRNMNNFIHQEKSGSNNKKEKKKKQTI